MPRTRPGFTGFWQRMRCCGRTQTGGLLDVDDGNSIYWECSGNPEGQPAVYIHGGPGSGSTPHARRFFDPGTYRIVLFDQRGCGRSRPILTHRSQLQANTTQHLINDLELLREHLAVERWFVLGASWGTTLALAYAQAHPKRVAGIVLAGVTTTSRREVEWITTEVGRIFPQQWERFVSHIP
ncbi:MAG TPA: alpha/beta fold hydrolase, partial [Candidatus Baltobacteraceae bacterium]|nr:alpha/beta fold hydrolase [Candidatus Baltobacteraceae bacterium]